LRAAEKLYLSPGAKRRICRIPLKASESQILRFARDDRPPVFFTACLWPPAGSHEGCLYNAGKSGKDTRKAMGTQVAASSTQQAMAPPVEVMIKTEDLWKTYDMGEAIAVHALSGVTFEIDRGEYVAIMGPSGSGKSTLMNLIGCLDTPTSGRYWLNSRLVSELSDDELAYIRNKEIGFVFQTFNLLSRASALHNVELPLVYSGVPAKERLEKAQEALQRVDLVERMNHKPNELSGGQRQRVAIARALVNNPSIILADEPTGNLDSATGEEIMGVFEKLYEGGNTIVLVTHEHDIAAHAHRIIHVRDGKIERDESVK